jgi:hypothetical protein
MMDELEQRWQQMFSALAAGGDLPPGPRLRAEGFMEAVVRMQLAAESDLDRAMDDCYRRAFGRGLAQDFGEDWRVFYPFPQIPAVARRAPVFPSTSD